MASDFDQPIPEKTQVHKDRLVGAKHGDLLIGDRVCEGRFGTIYRARLTSGAEVTLEVLRAGLHSNDEEVKAVNAINCAGVAQALSFGELPDGRRYRAMEKLNGESLDQVLRRRGALPAGEVAALLGQVAEVLASSHAWTLAHGNLGPSSVYVVGDGVKLIDFGLKGEQSNVEADLRQLGRLGFTLLAGAEVEEGKPPPPGSAPEALEVYLRDLLDDRIPDASAAKREFARLAPLLGKAPAPVASPGPAKRRSLLIPVLAVAALAVVGGGVAALVWPDSTTPVKRVKAPPEEKAPGTLEAKKRRPERTQRVPRRVNAAAQASPVRSAPVQTVAELQQQVTRLELKVAKSVAPEDAEQARSVLNKLRVRLTYSPNEDERREIAEQLALWRRSYLKR